MILVRNKKTNDESNVEVIFNGSSVEKILVPFDKLFVEALDLSKTFEVTEEELYKHYELLDYECKGVEFRICTTCNKIMTEGFVIADGDEYHCSEECLHTEVSEEEWERLTEYLKEEEDEENFEPSENYYGDTGCYWTQWN